MAEAEEDEEEATLRIKLFSLSSLTLTEETNEGKPKSLRFSPVIRLELP